MNDPVRGFLSRLKDVKMTGTDQWIARCPSHDDQHASLSISKGADGQVLLHCHAGCSPEQIVQSLDMELNNLFIKEERVDEKSWFIRDIKGAVIAEHHRLDKPDGKVIWWTCNGSKKLDRKVSELPLYGSERLPKLADGETVVVCEGEKAADAVRFAGLQAVGTVCGASVTPSIESLKPLERFDLVLWPDNDSTGHKHMAKIAMRLTGASIRWIDWPDAPQKGDAADTSTDTLKKLVSAATTTIVEAKDGRKYDSTLIKNLELDEVSAPIVAKDDRSVRIEWIGKQVAAEARTLKEHSDGRITGQLRIWATLPGMNRDLRSAQFNFSALRSRTELAKDLNNKLPEIGWDLIIEFICQTVTSHVQGGEPIEILTPSDDIKPITYTLWPLLITDVPIIIFGQEGTGKSYLALLLAYLAISGSKEHFEVFGVRSDKPIRSCLYLDWEGTIDVMRQRLSKLSAGTGLPDNGIQYRRCGRSLVSDVDQIKTALKGKRPDMIVIDSLIPAVGGDPLNSQNANDFFGALRSLGGTALLLGHTPKHTGGTASATVYGSGIFQFLARSIWEIRRHQEEEEDEIVVGLIHKKINYGRRERPIGFRFHFEPRATIITREDVSKTPEMESARTTTSRIIGYLKRNGTSSPKEIAEALEIPQNKIRPTLHYLRDKGKVTTIKRGEWGAIVHDEAPF